MTGYRRRIIIAFIFLRIPTFVAGATTAGRLRGFTPKAFGAAGKKSFLRGFRAFVVELDRCGHWTLFPAGEIFFSKKHRTSSNIFEHLRTTWESPSGID
jgi:hypothetical protein